MLVFKGKVKYGQDSSGSEQGPAGYSCEHGNEPSDSTKCGQFLA